MAGNTPVPDVVDAPTIGTATAGIESATVTFTAATTGGEATSFGALSTPGSITGTSATSPITVSGLTNGTAYTFKTYGINSSGTWSNVLSAASNSVTPTAATAFESIATVTLTSATSTISFTSIPATYTHLQIRAISKDSRSNSNSAFDIRLNGDSSSNYSVHNLESDGGSVFPGGTANTSSIGIGNSSGGTNANTFGVHIVDILDYTNTNKYKTVKTLGGHDQNGSGFIGLYSGNWRSTSAVTSITIIPLVANIKEYSQFALYGIKGS